MSHPLCRQITALLLGSMLVGCTSGAQEAGLQIPVDSALRRQITDSLAGPPAVLDWPLRASREGTRVPGSEGCQDCRPTYRVYTASGKQQTRFDGNESTKCCSCGSTQKFSNGATYLIRCENGRIIASKVAS